MITVINNFLSNEECDTFIELIESKIIGGVYNQFSNCAMNFNHKYVDDKLSTYFFNRFMQINKNHMDVICPNNIIMMAKYQVGEMFDIHTDTGLYYNKNMCLKTRYTLLIYLNDDFNGGETIFFTDHFSVLKTIIPKRGACLIFDIDLWHKGNKIINGTKYWIGCELIAPFNEE